MGLSIVEGFSKSLAMTVLSEIGDKTFFAAAILAMRHPRVTVLLGCLAALIVMTALSVVVGWSVPNLISRKWTHHITTLLFWGFGLWSLWEGLTERGESEELAEVEAKLDSETRPNKSQSEPGVKVESKLNGSSHARWMLTLSHHNPTPYLFNGKKIAVTDKRHLSIINPNQQKAYNLKKERLLAHLFSPIFLKAFSLTFFGEWGDKSQLATIGLASEENPFGVVLGGIMYLILPHTFPVYTAAVLGGKSLASRISEKMVALSGGMLFVAFGIQSYLSPIQGP